MKMTKWMIGLAVLALLLTALPSNVSANVVTIAPGDSYTKTVRADVGQLMPYQWSSDVTLHFTVTAPDSVVLTDEDSIYGFDVMTASQSGTYRFTWQNTGSTAATLNLMSFFADVEHGLSILVWGLIITAIVVVVVIVIVIVLVVMSHDKQKTQPVQQFGPSGPPMFAVGGKCPMCGSPVDPQGMFCEKCGARLK
jgi:hypothetical protein